MTRNKTFLDFAGLQTYDNQIKQTMNSAIPAISVDESTETLIFSLGTIIPVSSNEEEEQEEET